MHSLAYAESTGDAATDARAAERMALERSIALMQVAENKGASSSEAAEALRFTNSLWSTLLEDLAHPGNGLPDSLRASLISIGIWVLRRTEDIRLGRADSFKALIEVTQSIAGGLEKA